MSTRPENLADGLSALELAFLGDCVYELFVRERLCEQARAGKAAKIQVLAVEQVRASFQSGVYERLKPLLAETEADVLRRGRNASPKTVPKSAKMSDYRRATAVETLFGWLWIRGECERARELFGLTGETEMIEGTNETYKTDGVA